ncbi:hypothetical protein ACP70R_025804 [Stipagrostis hirtigluma subsp. patula]
MMKPANLDIPPQILSELYKDVAALRSLSSLRQRQLRLRRHVLNVNCHGVVGGSAVFLISGY